MSLLHGKPPFEIITSTKNRVSFLYLEYGAVLREENSIIFRKSGMDFDLPAANLSALLLGIGTTISQPAALEISRWGCNVSFVNGGGLGVHSSFLSTSSRNSRLLSKQAEIVSSQRKRRQSARLMYELRWNEEIPENLSISEMMRLEGSRVKALYRQESKRTGVSFERRVQQVDFDSNDLVNQMLTSGNAVMYGLCAAVITSIGLSTGLGVIHHGNANAFVFDIADLYKEEVIIPLAFDLASQGVLPNEMRARLREKLTGVRMMPRIVDDIYHVLSFDDTATETGTEEDSPSLLWNGSEQVDSGGNNLWQE